MSLPRTTNLWPPVDRTPAAAPPTAPVPPVKTTVAMVFAIGSVSRSGPFKIAGGGASESGDSGRILVMLACNGYCKQPAGQSGGNYRYALEVGSRSFSTISVGMIIRLSRSPVDTGDPCGGSGSETRTRRVSRVDYLLDEFNGVERLLRIWYAGRGS